jgi:riboflavin synthase
MFTGIIENKGTLVAIEEQGRNLLITVKSSITHELKVDQSLAHNGICLTVVKIEGDEYQIVAIHETRIKTNIDSWKVGDFVNLERAMLANGRFDGHIVQGHVDQVATCIAKEWQNGSWLFTFQYSDSKDLTVEKGSICVNGISLTVVDSKSTSFSVCIIPYTYENTNLSQCDKNSTVNLEFDILGKYIHKLIQK